MREKTLQIAVPDELFRKIQRLSQAERRTMSAYCWLLLERTMGDKNAV